MKTPTIISAAQMQGKDTVMALGDAFILTDGYPVLKVFNK